MPSPQATHPQHSYHCSPSLNTCSSQSRQPVVTRNVGTILQLNINRATKTKLSILQQIADSCNTAVAQLQEIHHLDSKSLYLAGFYLAAHQPSATHCIAAFVRHGSPAIITSESTPSSECVAQWHTAETSGMSFTNVYRPPPAPFSVHTLPMPPECDTVIVAGDFNCHRKSWGYSACDANGEALSHGRSHLTFNCSVIRRSLTVFALQGGTQPPILTSHLLV